MNQKYFDDWSVGEKFTTAGRTITETDVVMFAGMTGDYNELHTNRDFMEKDKQFGQRIAHGLLGLAVSHGLLSRMGFLEKTPIAFLGIESWQFKAPIYLGDTIHADIEVVDKRASRSKNDRGVVKFLLKIVKQDQTVVQEGFKTIMFKRESPKA